MDRELMLLLDVLGLVSCSPLRLHPFRPLGLLPPPPLPPLPSPPSSVSVSVSLSHTHTHARVFHTEQTHNSFIHTPHTHAPARPVQEDKFTLSCFLCLAKSSFYFPFSPRLLFSPLFPSDHPSVHRVLSSPSFCLSLLFSPSHYPIESQADILTDTPSGMDHAVFNTLTDTLSQDANVRMAAELHLKELQTNPGKMHIRLMFPGRRITHHGITRPSPGHRKTGSRDPKSASCSCRPKVAHEMNR